MSITNYPVYPGHVAISGTYNFTIQEVAKLMAMQDTLNSYIHPEWKSQNFNWNLAIQDEIMEIHGHLGWKWWKEGYLKGITEDNIQQIKLEVIDILHFVMSTTLEYAINVTHATRWLNSSMYAEGIGSFLHSLYSDATIGGAYWLEAWADLARCVGLTEQEVMETYTQKYVLNKFRQDHGYKDGSYVKEWDLGHVPGLTVNRLQKVEDNEVLAHIVRTWPDFNAGTLDEQSLYTVLESSYNGRLNQ